MRTTLLASVAALAALAMPARADDTDDGDGGRRHATYTVDFGSFARWYGDTSAASLTPSQMVGGQVTLARRVLDFGGPLDALGLATLARFGGGSSTGTIFNALDTRITQLAITGGARLELGVHDGLGLATQLDLGAARTETTIGDDLAEMAPVNDVAWGMIATASLAVTYEHLIRRRFSAGLSIHVGYTFASAVDVHAIPRTRPEDDLSIPTTFASLGSLDTRGLTAGLSFRGGF